MDPLLDPKNYTAIASLGAAFIFMIVVLAFAWKYTPSAIAAIKERSQADIKLAAALTGLTSQLGANQTQCQAAQLEFKDTVVEATEKLSKQLEDIKTIAVPTLRGVEAIQTTMQVEGRLKHAQT